MSSKKAATSDVPQNADSLVHRIIRMITDNSSANKRILALLPKSFRHVIPIIKMIFDSSSFLQDQVQDQVKEMEDAELALRLLIDENRNAVGTWRETNKIMFDANALAAYRSGMEPFLEVIESGVQILKGVGRGEDVVVAVAAHPACEAAVAVAEVEEIFSIIAAVQIQVPIHVDVDY